MSEMFERIAKRRKELKEENDRLWNEESELKNRKTRYVNDAFERYLRHVYHIGKYDYTFEFDLLYRLKIQMTDSVSLSLFAYGDLIWRNGPEMVTETANLIKFRYAGYWTQKQMSGFNKFFKMNKQLMKCMLDTREQIFDCWRVLDARPIEYWINLNNYLLLMWQCRKIFDRRLRCLIWKHVCTIEKT